MWLQWYEVIHSPYYYSKTHVTEYTDINDNDIWILDI